MFVACYTPPPPLGACELYHTLPSPKPNQKPHPRRNTVTSAKPSPRPSRKKSATPALAPCQSQQAKPAHGLRKRIADLSIPEERRAGVSPLKSPQHAPATWSSAQLSNDIKRTQDRLSRLLYPARSRRPLFSPLLKGGSTLEGTAGSRLSSVTKIPSARTSNSTLPFRSTSLTPSAHSANNSAQGSKAIGFTQQPHQQQLKASPNYYSPTYSSSQRQRYTRKVGLQSKRPSLRASQVFRSQTVATTHIEESAEEQQTITF